MYDDDGFDLGDSFLPHSLGGAFPPQFDPLTEGDGIERLELQGGRTGPGPSTDWPGALHWAGVFEAGRVHADSQVAVSSCDLTGCWRGIVRVDRIPPGSVVREALLYWAFRTPIGLVGVHDRLELESERGARRMRHVVRGDLLGHRFGHRGPAIGHAVYRANVGEWFGVGGTQSRFSLPGSFLVEVPSAARRAVEGVRAPHVSCRCDGVVLVLVLEGTDANHGTTVLFDSFAHGTNAAGGRLSGMRYSLETPMAYTLRFPPGDELEPGPEDVHWIHVASRGEVGRGQRSLQLHSFLTDTLALECDDHAAALSVVHADEARSPQELLAWCDVLWIG